MSLLLEPPWPEAVLVIIFASFAAVLWTLARAACCGEADKDSRGRLSRSSRAWSSARPKADASALRRGSSGASSSSARTAADAGSRAGYGHQSQGRLQHARRERQIELPTIPEATSTSRSNKDPRADDLSRSARRNEVQCLLPPRRRSRNTSSSADASGESSDAQIRSQKRLRQGTMPQS